MFSNEVPLHQSFHRRLLSEYDAEIALPNYIHYFELKKIAKRIENIVAKLSGYENGALQRIAFHRCSSVLFSPNESTVAAPPLGGGAAAAAASSGGSGVGNSLLPLGKNICYQHLNGAGLQFHRKGSGAGGGSGMILGFPSEMERSVTGKDRSTSPRVFPTFGLLSQKRRQSQIEKQLQKEHNQLFSDHPTSDASLPSSPLPPPPPSSIGETVWRGRKHSPHIPINGTPYHEEGAARSLNASSDGGLLATVGAVSASITTTTTTVLHSPTTAHAPGRVVTTVVSATIEEDEDLVDEEDPQHPLSSLRDGTGADEKKVRMVEGGHCGSGTVESMRDERAPTGTEGSSACRGEEREEKAGAPLCTTISTGSCRSPSRNSHMASSTPSVTNAHVKDTTPNDPLPRLESQKSEEMDTPDSKKDPLDAEEDEDGERKMSSFASPSTRSNRMITLLQERERLQRDFFRLLRQSFDHVCRYLVKMENAIVEEMQKMRELSEKEIRRHQNTAYLEQLYLKVQRIEKYRCLNLLSMERLFHKFLTRCAQDSLDLQARVGEWNEVVVDSPLMTPNVDLRGFLLELITVYGIVYALSYEEAIAALRRFEARESASTPRILGPSETSFLNTFLPMQKRFGSFAIRLLAGSASVRLEKALSGVLRCGRFSPSTGCTTIASNGEVDVDLSETVRGDDVYVVQSTVHTPEKRLSMNGTLMELALLLQSVRLAGASRVTAVVPYMGYTRDTVSISAIAEIVEAMGCHHLITLDLDSEQVEGCFSIPMEVVSAKMEFVRFVIRQLTAEGNDFSRITIVAPRDLYLRRAKEFADAIMREGHLHPETQLVSVCTAVQRQRVERDGKQVGGRRRGGGETVVKMMASSTTAMKEGIKGEKKQPGAGGGHDDLPPPPPFTSLHHTPVFSSQRSSYDFQHPSLDSLTTGEDGTPMSTRSNSLVNQSTPIKNMTAPPSRRPTSFLFHTDEQESILPHTPTPWIATASTRSRSNTDNTRKSANSGGNIDPKSADSGTSSPSTPEDVHEGKECEDFRVDSGNDELPQNCAGAGAAQLSSSSVFSTSFQTRIPTAPAHSHRDPHGLTPVSAKGNSVHTSMNTALSKNTSGLAQVSDHVYMDPSYPPDISASPLFKGGMVDPSGMEYALSVQKQGQRAIICSKKQSNSEEEAESEGLLGDKFHLVGDVKGRLCIIVDTMIDEALDVAAVSRALMRNGAERVLAVATHPIFSGKAVERLKNAPVDLVVVSDSINQDEVMRDPLMAKKIRIVPISPLLALAIEKIHTESKLSMLL